MMQKVVLGTRGSALALAQTELTRAALEGAFPGLKIEVETFVTQGDKKLDLNLLNSPGGGKGLFTKELEVALLERRIDVAVHSLKDLPGNMPAGLELSAVLQRAATGDVLLSKSAGGLDGLPHGSRVGTSSIRRAKQLRWLRPDLEMVEWRGNVQTRLRKLRDGEGVGGIVLAQAGLDRLGFATAGGLLEFEGAQFAVSSLEDRMWPAIGQGAVALQSERSRLEVGELLRGINHEPTWIAVAAERELQRCLAGDCTLPVGVRTEVLERGVRLSAVLFVEGEASPRRAEAEAASPEAAAREVARGLGVASD
ncbi:MAG: hydroxymethylbilane synthase [Verrucomicrobiota bacterium]